MGGEITCEITGTGRRSDVDGKGLEFPWESLNDQETTCEGDYKQLIAAV